GGAAVGGERAAPVVGRGVDALRVEGRDEDLAGVLGVDRDRGLRLAALRLAGVVGGGGLKAVSLVLDRHDDRVRARLGVDVVAVDLEGRRRVVGLPYIAGLLATVAPIDLG